MRSDLEELLTDYAIEHLDWPETDEQIDAYLDEFELGRSTADTAVAPGESE